MTDTVPGKILHHTENFTVSSVNAVEAPDDLRVVFTDMFHKQTMKMIGDADRIGLFNDMDAKDQLSCVQSGILGALAIYISAITPTKEIFEKLTGIILEAMPLILNNAEMQTDELRAKNGFPPKPAK